MGSTLKHPRSYWDLFIPHLNESSWYRMWTVLLRIKLMCVHCGLNFGREKSSKSDHWNNRFKGLKVLQFLRLNFYEIQSNCKNNLDTCQTMMHGNTRGGFEDRWTPHSTEIVTSLSLESGEVSLIWIFHNMYICAYMCTCTQKLGSNTRTLCDKIEISMQFLGKTYH